MGVAVGDAVGFWGALIEVNIIVEFWEDDTGIGAGVRLFLVGDSRNIVLEF